MYDFTEIKKSLSELGIQQGDIVYVASDITSLLCMAFKQGVKKPAQRDQYLSELVDVFQGTVGKTGTLLFPVFSWDFCRGKNFDIRTSLGEVGNWNNWILQNRNDFLRTRHPMYSFMVWGQDAPLLAALDNKDAWGKDSPFAYLHHHGGKMVLFNVSLQRGFTFMHYIEQSSLVPYRYMKAFKGTYIDSKDRSSERVYTMYVRDLDIISEEYLPDSFLLQQGAMREIRENQTAQILKVIDLPFAFDVVSDDLKNHGGEHCYKFTNYKIDWSKGATHEDDFSNGLPG